MTSRSRAISAKGFASRRLPLAQPRDRLGVGRVAREVIAAEALDGDNLPVCGAARAPRRRRRASTAGRGARRGRRSAMSRALGPQTGQAIASAWKRRSAGSRYSARRRAHSAKARHGRQRAVVGDRGDDAEPRTAMGAVGERIAEAALGRIGDLGARTPRQIAASGATWVCTAAACTIGDAELADRSAAIGWRLDDVDARQRRRLACDAVEKVLDRRGSRRRRAAGRLRRRSALRREIEFARHPPHVRAKAHPLHAAAHANFHREIVWIAGELAPWRHGATHHRSTRLLGMAPCQKIPGIRRQRTLAQ